MRLAIGTISQLRQTWATVLANSGCKHGLILGGLNATYPTLQYPTLLYTTLPTLVADLSYYLPLLAMLSPHSLTKFQYAATVAQEWHTIAAHTRIDAQNLWSCTGSS